MVVFFYSIWIYANLSGYFLILGFVPALGLLIAGAWLDTRLPAQTKRLWPEGNSNPQSNQQATKKNVT